jgi:hypothetical protein
LRPASNEGGETGRQFAAQLTTRGQALISNTTGNFNTANGLMALANIEPIDPYEFISVAL